MDRLEEAENWLDSSQDTLADGDLPWASVYAQLAIANALVALVGRLDEMTEGGSIGGNNEKAFRVYAGLVNVDL